MTIGDLKPWHCGKSCTLAVSELFVTPSTMETNCDSIGGVSYKLEEKNATSQGDTNLRKSTPIRQIVFNLGRLETCIRRVPHKRIQPFVEPFFVAW